MDPDKLNQIAAVVVAVIIGVWSWFRGAKHKPESDTEEVARLRDKLIEARDTNTTLALEGLREDIGAVRTDFEEIIKALNVSTTTQIQKFTDEIGDLAKILRGIDDRLHAAERKLDVVEDRQRRGKG